MKNKKIMSCCFLYALFCGTVFEIALAEGQGPSPAAAVETVSSALGGQQTVQPAAVPPLVAGDQTVIPAHGNVVQPAPLSVTESPAGIGRDPFVAPPRKIFTPDYGKGMDACLLRGICKVGRKQVGIFSTAGKGGSSASSKVGERFQQVSVGEQIKFFSEDVEYILTVRELGARSAVLVGENKQVYKVYL